MAASPGHVVAVQGPVGSPFVEVTWDRNDATATKYEVLRDDVVIGTVGPFIPYDWTNSAHQSWYGSSNGGYAATVLSKTPVFHFRLEGTGAAQTDASGNGLTAETERSGSPNALTNVTGGATGESANNAKQLNGTSDSFAVFANAALEIFAGAWSIALLVKRGRTGVQEDLFRKGANTPLLRLDSATNTIVVRQFGGSEIVRSTSALTDTTGYHLIVITCAGSTSAPKIYLDGTNVTGTPSATPSFGNTAGFINIGGGSFFQGNLDEPALFARELSASDVTDLYNSLDDSPVSLTQPYDDTWDKCVYRDSAVAAGQTYTYKVRAYVGASSTAPGAGTSITVHGDSNYGTIYDAGAPSGGDDSTAIQAAITAAEAVGGIARLNGGGAVYKAIGLQMAGKKMVFRGGGKDATYLRPFGAGGAVAGSTAPKIITVAGAQTSLGTILSTAIQPGDTTATFSSVTGMAVGSVLELSAPSIGGTAEAAYARGDVITPGAEYDEISRWECQEITAINGNVVTFKYPFTQNIPTTATVVRLAEATLGSPQRNIVIESMSIEGVSVSDTTYFRGIDVSGTVGFRLASVRSRYLNGNVMSSSHCYDHTSVDVDEPHHGVAADSTSQYSFDTARVANSKIISCDIGTNGSVLVKSCFAHQRTPRALVRNSIGRWAKNYVCNEHGGGSRDWIFENCWFNLGTTGPSQGTTYGGVFLGNPDFANSGRGIVRNCRQDGGPDMVYVREHGYGIRVLDCIAYGLAKFTATNPNDNSLDSALVVWGGWDAPAESSSNWGAAKLTIKRNALFGSTQYGVWLGRRNSAYFTASDPAGDGTGYLGIRDVIMDDNYFNVTGARIFITGTSSTSGRYSVTGTRGSAAGSHADVVPTLASGCYWDDNNDSVATFGSPFSTQTWEAETFPWTQVDASDVDPSTAGVGTASIGDAAGGAVTIAPSRGRSTISDTRRSISTGTTRARVTISDSRGRISTT
jgi:hypothetical protein